MHRGVSPFALRERQFDLSYLTINKDCRSYFSVRISVGLEQTHHELPSLFSYRQMYVYVQSKCLGDAINRFRSILALEQSKRCFTSAIILRLDMYTIKEIQTSVCRRKTDIFNSIFTA